MAMRLVWYYRASSDLNFTSELPGKRYAFKFECEGFRYPQGVSRLIYEEVTEAFFLLDIENYLENCISSAISSHANNKEDDQI